METKILIVDDDVLIQAVLKQSLIVNLKNIPIKIDKVDNFVSAQKQIENNTYDIIFLDGDFPISKESPKEHAFGGDLIYFIKESSPETICVTYSGKNDSNQKMLEISRSLNQPVMYCTKSASQKGGEEFIAVIEKIIKISTAKNSL